MPNALTAMAVMSWNAWRRAVFWLVFMWVLGDGGTANRSTACAAAGLRSMSVEARQWGLPGSLSFSGSFFSCGFFTPDHPDHFLERPMAKACLSYPRRTG